MSLIQLYLIAFLVYSFPNMSMNVSGLTPVSSLGYLKRGLTTKRGEYRSRTDDLLRARQAL